MRAVVQRVSSARVDTDGITVGEIGKGFLVLLGIHCDDTQRHAAALANKIAGLRVFTDENDKMNLTLTDVGGNLLVVSNFTLYGDCSHGRRPSFVSAARPDTAKPLYEFFCKRLEESGFENVQRGVFGADMAVSLVNDGPVTLIIDTDDLKNC